MNTIHEAVEVGLSQSPRTCATARNDPVWEAIRILKAPIHLNAIRFPLNLDKCDTTPSMSPIKELSSDILKYLETSAQRTPESQKSPFPELVSVASPVTPKDKPQNDALVPEVAEYVADQVVPTEEPSSPEKSLLTELLSPSERIPSPLSPLSPDLRAMSPELRKPSTPEGRDHVGVSSPKDEMLLTPEHSPASDIVSPSPETKQKRSKQRRWRLFKRITSST